MEWLLYALESRAGMNPNCRLHHLTGEQLEIICKHCNKEILCINHLNEKKK